MDFDKIETTGSDLTLLKALRNEPIQKGENCTRLIRLKLAIEQLEQRTPGCMPTGSGAVDITELGLDYLLYVGRKTKEKRTEWLRYTITTAIAVAAFIKSFFF